MKGAACIFLLALSACAQTEFLDDFEDGHLHRVYAFRIGDASSVNEAAGVLSTSNYVQMYVPAIPGILPTDIVPPVELSLDVVNYISDVNIELGLADSGMNPQDYFVVGVEGQLAGKGAYPICYDEQERTPLEGIVLYPPITLSIRAETNGTVTGSFSDATGTVDCPSFPPFPSAGYSLDAAIVLWAGAWEGEERYAEVDNLDIVLLGEEPGIYGK